MDIPSVDERGVLVEPEQLAQILADFFREEEDAIVRDMYGVYRHRYTHSASRLLPDDIQYRWSQRVLREFGKDITGTADPTRYERSNAGDNVIQVEEILSPIYMFAETYLYMGRVLAPLIWQRFVDKPGLPDELIAFLESRIQAAVVANVHHFLNRFQEPGILSRSWNLCPPPGSLAASTTAEAAAEPSAPGDTLTPRERAVLELAVTDRSNKEISSELGVSLSTVKGYMSKLFEKYGVRSRSELTSVVTHGQAQP